MSILIRFWLKHRWFLLWTNAMVNDKSYFNCSVRIFECYFRYINWLHPSHRNKILAKFSLPLANQCAPCKSGVRIVASIFDVSCTYYLQLCASMPMWLLKTYWNVQVIISGTFQMKWCHAYNLKQCVNEISHVFSSHLYMTHGKLYHTQCNKCCRAYHCKFAMCNEPLPQTEAVLA